MKLESLFTKPAAEAGIKLPLTLPDGSKTDSWLKVLGTDSEAFRRAAFEIARRREQMRGKQLSYEEVQRERLDIACTLVVDWNLDEEFSPENVRLLLENAPQVLEAIDKVSDDRALFLPASSDSLKTTPSGATSSKKGQKTAS